MRLAVMVTVLAVLAAPAAQGQIGASSAGFSNRWGASVSGQLDADGNGVLQFADGEMTVEAEFIGGVAQRTSYRGPALDQQAVQALLDENSGGASWQRFRQPGRDPQLGGKSKWMRSDEQSMAEMGDGTVTIIGPDYNQHRAKLAASAAGGGPKADEAPPANATNLLAAARSEDFIGFWRSKGSGQPTVVLDVPGPEGLSWVVFGVTEQWSISLRWECEVVGQRTTYALRRTTQAGAEESAPAPQVLGRLELVATNMLRWRAETTLGDEGAGSRPEEMKTGTLFDRIDKMPPWKPGAPATLPAKGDSRESVIRLLGKPTGTMSLSGREVLTYPWGKVWIANGVVLSVD